VNILHNHTKTYDFVEKPSKHRHNVCIENAKSIAKQDHYIKIKIREVLEIGKNENILNKDGKFELRHESWGPVIHLINDKLNHGSA